MKKVKKQKKDEVVSMINQIEFTENSETFRNLAKQFYENNVRRGTTDVSQRKGSSRRLNDSTQLQPVV